MKPLLYALLPRPPHPSRDGGAIRMRHLLAGLASEFRVRAFVLKAAGAPSGDYPPSVEAAEVPHAAGRWRRARAAAASLALGGASSERLYRSAALEEALADACARERPAWVVAHSWHLGASAAGSGAPSWIDFQNLDSEIWARTAASASSAAVRLYARVQAPRVAALERVLVRRADGISCVSARDAAALEALSPRARPLLVPNGVDLARYRFRPEPAREERLFFVGDLSWPPNAEGIRWFRDRVWPQLKRLRPAVRVEVLGRGAPPAWRGEADADFRFLGEGEDTRPYWEEAALGIAPLLAGGGTRLKILEAAACGVPVVATEVAAEGLELSRGDEIAVAGDPRAFAEAAAGLLADPAARRRMAAAARSRVEALYDWTPIAAAFAAELARRSRAR